jgi:hypothetical protein
MSLSLGPAYDNMAVSKCGDPLLSSCTEWRLPRNPCLSHEAWVAGERITSYRVRTVCRTLPVACIRASASFRIGRTVRNHVVVVLAGLDGASWWSYKPASRSAVSTAAWQRLIFYDISPYCKMGWSLLLGGSASKLDQVAGWSILILAAVLVLCIVVNEIVRFSSRIRGLPGPRGYPLVGSLHSLRGKSPAEEYRIWAQRYGPVFQLQLGNVTTVVVNSAAAARAFFISQREATNGRPRFYVLHSRVQKGNAVTSIGTSEWDHSCKRRRKVAATALNKTSVESYLPVSIFA